MSEAGERSEPRPEGRVAERSRATDEPMQRNKKMARRSQ